MCDLDHDVSSDLTLNKDLKIEFVPPERGWTTVKLQDKEKSYEFTASYLPMDSFKELRRALINTADREVRTIAQWNSEPTEHYFVFEWEGYGINFKVFEKVRDFNGNIVEKERFSFSGAPYDTLYSFWEGLREMHSKQDPDDYLKHWRSVYPHEELGEVYYKIDQHSYVCF